MEIELDINASKLKLIAGLKLIAIALIIVIAGILINWQKRNAQINFGQTTGFSTLITQGTKDNILIIPYQQTLYKHFGNVINPQAKLPIKTIKGYQEMEFLIDSGAVVSALPQTQAENLGVDLTQLPRITIEGFAGQKTFAYKGEFIIRIGKDEVLIPVVFSENPQANNILGRIGFFDNFNITFDANQKTIIITKKS